MPCAKMVGTVALDHKILKSSFQQGTQWMELLRGAHSWAGRSSALSSFCNVQELAALYWTCYCNGNFKVTSGRNKQAVLTA